MLMFRCSALFHIHILTLMFNLFTVLSLGENHTSLNDQNLLLHKTKVFSAVNCKKSILENRNNLNGDNSSGQSEQRRRREKSDKKKENIEQKR